MHHECMAAPFTPPPAEDLGGRIRQARSYAGLTQKQLGNLTGNSRETISSWEKGHTSPTVTQLRAVASATHFALVWFIEGLDDGDGVSARKPRDPAQLTLLNFAA